MEEILLFIAIGFVAQMIDGTLGMAYGVSATSFLLTFGIPPAVASASVHAAEVVTTAVSGVSHFKFGNVDKLLLRRLVLPGMIGAVFGAYVLTAVPSQVIKPFVTAYLLLMGVYIILKALRKIIHRRVHTHLIPLGFTGGFLDACGGGGWGPIVVSTLLVRGNHPRFTIGSSNTAEFFIALSASLTFVSTIGFSYWDAILGLAIGGALAAPIAAYLSSKVPTRALMLAVGILIIGLSVRTLYLTMR